MKYRCLGFALTLLFASSTWAGGETAKSDQPAGVPAATTTADVNAGSCSLSIDMDTIARNLAAKSPDEVARAVEMLRSFGPAGLEAALKWYDAAPDSMRIPAVEAIAGQRGAVVSRLYWYTDLDQAKAAARSRHKPILYLRMLGKLTDEYSCANSRFFRTVLYSNAGVSKVLREQFVLVWVSERPVPVVTIDNGDGRVLKRTLTGNSIHYVLDADGNVIDALPGLYGPLMFQAVIKGAARLASVMPGITDSARREYLAREDDQILNVWKRYAVIPADSLKQIAAQKTQPAAPPANMAMRLAVSKRAVEAPLLRQVSPDFAAALEDSINTADAATWDRIAAAYSTYSVLDASSIGVIRSENSKAYQDPEMLKKTVDHFQKLIALDTVHNNFQFRRQILAWLRESPAKMSVEDLNKRVYSELFLTPATDPWLGLMPEATYTALCDDGCVKP